MFHDFVFQRLWIYETSTPVNYQSELCTETDSICRKGKVAVKIMWIYHWHQRWHQVFAAKVAMICPTSSLWHSLSSIKKDVFVVCHHSAVLVLSTTMQHVMSSILCTDAAVMITYLIISRHSFLLIFFCFIKRHSTPVTYIFRISTCENNIILHIWNGEKLSLTHVNSVLNLTVINEHVMQLENCLSKQISHLFEALYVTCTRTCR